MRIFAALSQYGQYESNLRSGIDKNDNFMGVMSAASTPVEKQEDGDVLGISMNAQPGTKIFWGMKAKYASCSTSDNPIIYVETNYGGKTVSYNININNIDPSNASRLEMFALCSYADNMGIGDKSTFGTYSTLRTFEEMANHNGYIGTQGELNGFNQFQSEKLDWVDMSKQVMALLFKCNDLIQYSKGLSIMDLFSKTNLLSKTRC
ncbi:MAG: hypothetical protein Q8920_12995 [Bacillota bacterium]|nr:hypothetical protein [Bacillota bacterium]